MKKLTAIFLLFSFMINLVGYRVWYHFELKSADHQMESLLDKVQYEEADLLTIRIPLSLPYQNDITEFERISGEVSFKGKIYKYVKRKIENGDFVLMCLPDYNKMQLEREKNDHVKNSVDQNRNNSNKSGSGSGFFKYAFSEFEQNIHALQIIPLFASPVLYGSHNAGSMQSLQVAAPGQPPDNNS